MNLIFSDFVSKNTVLWNNCKIQVRYLLSIVCIIAEIFFFYFCLALLVYLRLGLLLGLVGCWDDSCIGPCFWLLMFVLDCKFGSADFTFLFSFLTVFLIKKKITPMLWMDQINSKVYRNGSCLKKVNLFTIYL